MRNEATNTWSEGMIKDLNPINTPNNVLTDCLNGTIITYDGNEFSLQNDKGNYPLKNCKLDKNYIPVGLKEYAGILYIVSYNPLTDEAQIGSYPSIAQVTSTDKKANIEMIEPIPLSTDSSATMYEYAKLVEDNCSLKVIYGDDPEEYKLNPGDDYRLSIEQDTSGWKYQGINYYILSEDSKLYDISNLIFKGKADSNGFRKVSWGVPGWLAMQLKIAEIDNCTISLQGSPKIPVYLQAGSTASAEFRISVSTSDPLIYLVDNPDLYVDWEVKCSSDSNFRKTGTSKLTNRQNIYNGSYSYRCTTDLIEGIPITEDSTITVTATPRLCNMKYEPVSITYNISNKNEIGIFNIGDDKWWYYTSRDESLLNIQFSIGGLESLSLAEDLSLKYTLYKICNDGTIKTATDIFGAEISNRQVEDWVPGNIEGEISLKLSNNLPDNSTAVEAESMYLIEFNLYSAESSEPLKTASKLIIASELFNKVQSNKYDNVSFDDWFGKYQDTVKDNTILITNIENPNIGEKPKAIVTSEGAKGAWNTDIDIKDYSCFLETPNFKQVKQNGFKISAALDYKVGTTYTSPVSLLYGPMWNDTLNNLKVNFSSNSGVGSLQIDKSTGKISSSNPSLSNTISGKYSKTVSYIPEPLTNYDSKIWTYVEEKTLGEMAAVQYIRASVRDVNKDNDTSTFNISSSTGTYTVTSSNTSLTIPSIQSFASMLEKHRVLLASVSVVAANAPTKGTWGAYLSLRSGGDVLMGVDTNPNGGNHDTKSRYFLIIPASDTYKTVQFIEVGSDASAAETLCSEVLTSISRIKCNDDAKVGGFITMKQDISQPVYPSSSVQITGSFNPSVFNYAGFNLLNSDGRKKLQELIKSKVGSDIKLTNLDSNDYTNTFPVIKLEDKSESLSFAFDTSLIDIELEKENTKVLDRNKKILDQYDNFLADRFLSGVYTETTDLYYLNSPENAKQLCSNIVNILNAKAPSSYNKLNFYIENWRGGWHPETSKTASIGYYDPSITIA